MRWIDINCDMGESWKTEQVGQDAALMPFISSCNLACGVHGGDQLTRQKTIGLALAYEVAIGAHPSLPDRANFGREPVDLPADKLTELVYTQVKRLQDEALQLGTTLHHIKPHGALYHLASQRNKEAQVVVEVALQLGVPMIYGFPDSVLAEQAQKAGLNFVAEGFIDRVYETGGQALRSRKKSDAIILDCKIAADQAVNLAIGKVTDYTGITHPMQVKTLCLHGDHPEALEHIQAVHTAFDHAGIKIKAC